jgi:hypothetical protein
MERENCYYIVGFDEYDYPSAGVVGRLPNRGTTVSVRVLVPCWYSFLAMLSPIHASSTIMITKGMRRKSLVIFTRLT